MWRGLLLAIAFLTRIPVRLPAELDARDQGMAVAAYPLVGLGIGFLLAMLGATATWLGLPALPAAVVIVSVLAALTGALHLDGLADTADAWLGGHGDRERTLAIMKDPTCGPAGVVVLVLALLAKVAAVAVLLEVQHGWIGLLSAPLLGRAACALLFPVLPYVRAGGLGESGARHLAGSALAVTAGGSAVVTLALGGWAGVVMLVTAMAVFALGVRLMRRVLGGFTGDTAGALLETVETAVLVAAVMVLAGAGGG
ncbi:adenosylcobinamide-GDP ribazoletransferase [Aquisalimonas sp. 2447]|uniref:adenosylcobinamide-GDP ribazoletransferase n=1 Tax=Aquisalimonas sp. 2447 TaxID=2740807 RepID=UPI0014327153|nr:adenosylcobinamide-GDP ribazoletransferase [Aquisalimonas sp. 2447]QIT53839.1 adenosylcobinamide-GDP ribazoletransferase [Aquisalimonas sp. 2447]